MPSKYQDIIDALQKVLDEVHTEPYHARAEQVAHGISELAKNLQNAGKAYLFTASLVGAASAIGNSVLEISGNTDINDANCRPVPNIDSDETFKLSITMLKLLFALDPKKNPAAQDYLDCLGIAPGGWPKRIQEAPQCIFDNMLNYLFKQNDEKAQELLSEFPKVDFQEFKNKLSQERNLSLERTNAENLDNSCSTSMSGINRQVINLFTFAKKQQKLYELLKNGISIYKCGNFNDFDLTNCDLTKANIIIDDVGNNKLVWLNRYGLISMANITQDTIDALSPVDAEHSVHEYKKRSESSPVLNAAYREIKNKIGSTTYHMNTLRLFETHDIEEKLAANSSSEVYGNAQNQANIFGINSRNLWVWSAVGLSVVVSAITRESSAVKEATKSLQEYRINEQTANAAASVKKQNQEKFKVFLNEAAEIHCKIKELTPTLNARRKRIQSYLLRVNHIIKCYEEDPSPNKLLQFTDEQFITEEGVERQKTTIEDEMLVQQEDEINNFEQLKQLFINLDYLDEDSRFSLSDEQMAYYSDLCNKISDLKAQIIDNIGVLEFQAVKTKQRLFLAVKENTNPNTKFEVFSDVHFSPSWYLKALSLKATPYVCAIAFAVATAAAVISIGVLTGSPAFALFGVQALANLVTPLCLTGAVAGSALSITSAASLASAGMYSNLRKSPPTIEPAPSPAAAASL